MREIYLDNCATTCVDEPVAKVAADMMLNDYGNPSSLHKKGLQAELRLDSAREQTAASLGCAKDEVVFTSGGTEANNLAILGGFQARHRVGSSIVATAWEHSSVLAPMRELEKRGLSLKLVSPSQDGHINVDDIVGAVDSETLLVSCMMVNSEVGSITDIAELVRKIRRKNSKTLIHCDAVQGFGKLDFSVKKLDVDLLSVSGHKIHAPKGVGALFVKKSVRILPITFGGGQEKGLRAGTYPTPLIAAFGVAAKTAAADLAKNFEHARKLCEHFVNKSAEISALCMNSPVDATPYVCNFSLPGYRSEIMLHYLSSKGIYVSSGSACSSGKASHVLTAMKLPRERVDSAIRVSFSKYNKIEDIDALFDALSQGLREITV